MKCSVTLPGQKWDVRTGRVLTVCLVHHLRNSRCWSTGPVVSPCDVEQFSPLSVWCKAEGEFLDGVTEEDSDGTRTLFVLLSSRVGSRGRGVELYCPSTVSFQDDNPTLVTVVLTTVVGNEEGGVVRGVESWSVGPFLSIVGVSRDRRKSLGRDAGSGPKGQVSGRLESILIQTVRRTPLLSAGSQGSREVRVISPWTHTCTTEDKKMRTVCRE